jgi:hypothetical protein
MTGAAALAWNDFSLWPLPLGPPSLDERTFVPSSLT